MPHGDKFFTQYQNTPVLTERTSKAHKLQIAIAGFTVFAMFCLCIAVFFVSVYNTDGENLTFFFVSLGLLVLSIIWVVIVQFRAWWHHG